MANSRGPETLAPSARELGASILPKSVVSASGAEIIFLAVPFSAHKEIAAQLPHWNGKILVDATNAFHAGAGELGDRLSSEIVADAFTILSLSHASLPARDLAKLCQRAENEYVHSPCGIMDPFAIIASRQGAAIVG